MNIHITSDIIASIVRHLNIKFDKTDKQINDIIENWNVDINLKRMFQWEWLVEDLDIGPVIFGSPNIIANEIKNNYLIYGFVQFGWCANGDEILMNINSSEIYYRSHDESDDFKVKGVNGIYLTYNNIDYFLINIRNQNFIPYDSYSAREYYQLFGGK